MTQPQHIKSWRDDAACFGVDPEVFFPENDDYEGVHAAKMVCARCPVRADCLDYALTRGERGGIWGGLTEKERRRVRVPCVTAEQLCPTCDGILIPDGPHHERCVDCRTRWFTC